MYQKRTSLTQRPYSRFKIRTQWVISSIQMSMATVSSLRKSSWNLLLVITWRTESTWFNNKKWTWQIGNNLFNMRTNIKRLPLLMQLENQRNLCFNNSSVNLKFSFLNSVTIKRIWKPRKLNCQDSNSTSKFQRHRCPTRLELLSPVIQLCKAAVEPLRSKF